MPEEHLEAVILDGSSSKFFCAALARWEPTSIRPSPRTFVYPETWDNFVSYLVESVAKYGYEGTSSPTAETPDHRDQRPFANNRGPTLNELLHRPSGASDGHTGPRNPLYCCHISLAILEGEGPAIRSEHLGGLTRYKVVFAVVCAFLLFDKQWQVRTR